LGGDPTTRLLCRLDLDSRDGRPGIDFIKLYSGAKLFRLNFHP
jgi:hypothetical protein